MQRRPVATRRSCWRWWRSPPSSASSQYPGRTDRPDIARHVGFYAIGAYTVAILTLKGVSFWIALPLAGLIAGAIGLLLSLPALRVSGPYLAMVTIAFAFIVQHLSIEWRELTGGSNGLMGLPPPSIAGTAFTEREMALLAIAVAGASMLLF